MTLADIHMKASKFEKRIGARNAREYVACGLTIVGFAPALLLGPNWMLHVGGGLVILATLYVAWQLHRRGSSEATPAVIGAGPRWKSATLVSGEFMMRPLRRCE